MEFPGAPWRPLLAAVLVALLMAVAGERMVELEARHFIQAQREEVLAEASAVRGRLEAEVSASANLALGLAAFVSSHPDITQAQFDVLARGLARYGRHVRTVSLAPGGVIRFVHPLAGNEGVLGVDLSARPEHRQAVQRAIDAGEAVLAGPVGLVQGGEAFANRIPIHMQGEAGARGSYWGVASVALDSQSIFGSAGVYELPKRVRVAMRGRDALGAAGEVFLGDPVLFTGDAVLLDVMVPGGKWQLAAARPGGWGGDVLDRQTRYLRIAVLVLSLSMGGLAYGVLAERAMIRHLALHDSLTKLPNRRLFSDRLQTALTAAERARSGAALLYLDLDGFKEVNDSLGHKAGDRVLRETAQRVGSVIRKSDTLARVGGDEFMLILPGCRSVEDAERTAHKIIDRVGEPILVGTRTARIGVSIGVALYPGDGEDPDQLIRTADRAMYAAKASGNTVRHLEQPATAAGA